MGVSIIAKFGIKHLVIVVKKINKGLYFFDVSGSRPTQNNFNLYFYPSSNHPLR